VARQLDEFFSMASHDIRAPVTAMGGYVQLARAHANRLVSALRTRGEQDAELVKPLMASLVRADESGERLMRLVTLLFDVARARADTLALSLASCDLAALVHEQVAAQQAVATGRIVTLDVPEQLVSVTADADRIGQVLANYLTNALKYSADDQPIAVYVVVIGESATVSVRDHGPGLPLEEQRRVWDLSYRVPGVEVQGSTGTTNGSLGMGLYLCKRLIELHPGGEVGVESAVGEGSTFWFRLPIAIENTTQHP
jgi:signal transduction histidine kinase